MTREDLDRLEAILRDIAENTETSKAEKAATLVQLFQGKAELSVFFTVYVLPFLRSVVGS